MGKKIETRPASGSQAVAWIALVANIATALYLGAQIRKAGGASEDLSARLAALEAGVSRVTARVEEVARAKPPQAPPTRGPDPNRVYAIRTEGAPAKGNPSAPVVIAEVSDFQ